MRAFEGGGYKVGREWIVVVERGRAPETGPKQRRDESREWDETLHLAPCHLMI
jgi:hypothetical protein